MIIALAFVLPFTTLGLTSTRAQTASCPVPSSAVTGKVLTRKISVPAIMSADETVASTTTTTPVAPDQRSYLLYIPKSYTPDQATPLVFTIHGFGASAANQLAVTGWTDLAATENVIIVSPEGAYFPQRWNSGDSQFVGSSRMDDVAFFRAMITELSAELCIDPARIYANGYSNGGGMTNRLACEMSAVFAAVGTVAGALSPLDSCPTQRAVPYIAFHGTSDPVVPFEGLPDQALPAAQEYVDTWVQRDGCQPEPVVTAVATDVRQLVYSGCDNSAEVDFYIINDGGHTWPGSSLQLAFLGKTTQTIRATRLMWAFFQAHPL